MNERIRKLRKTLDLTQSAFAEKIGMKQNSVALVESGKRNISDYALRVICREFNVNEVWLRDGEGEMFNPSPASEIDALAQRYDLSDGACALIEKFVGLKPEQQDAVLQFILQAADALKDSGYAAAPSPADIAAAEAAYEKSLGIAPNTESTALNTTGGMEKRSEVS